MSEGISRQSEKYDVLPGQETIGSQLADRQLLVSAGLSRRQQDRLRFVAT